MKRYVIGAGNPWDGINLYGWFDDPEAANDHGDREMNGLDWWVVGVQQVETPWGDNYTQFARLLAEIMGVGLDEAQWDQLLATMDLGSDDLSELFDRADAVWQQIKQHVSGIPETPS